MSNANENEQLDEYYYRLEGKYGARNYNPLPVVLTRAEGAWIWDIHEKKYLDCLSSYSAANLGHRHPAVVATMKNQLDRLTLTSRAFYNDQLGPFMAQLCEFTGMDKALPMNTGAEAVETGIKAARRWGYREKKVPKDKAEIIVCTNNFHGRTTTIVGFSSDDDSREDFGPATPGFITIPFNDPQALENAITPNTVAFLVEPVQGEAGVVVPKPGYLKRVSEICHQNNVLLMCDEIQTGLCRTGKRFAYMHEISPEKNPELMPDIMTIGKALGGGVYPVSVTMARKDVMKVFSPGSHGSTFGGNPLACAVGRTSLDIFVKEKLDERAAENGAYFLDKLKHLSFPCLKEVRGKGLLLAFECYPEYGNARVVTEDLLAHGILTKDTHKYTVRMAPPLIITKEEIDWAVGVIAGCLERHSQRTA
jgi:ornithine--oxo-acid transaminase